MIVEILAWSTLFYGASLILPCVVPTFYSKYKYINTLPRPVFENYSQIIDDLRQHEYNGIDRTVGQLVATGAQILIVAVAFIDLFTPVPYLTSLVIGFYLHDMIHLATKPYGQTLQIYLVHHAATIALVSYCYLIQSPYTTESDILYIFLETSSISINMVNIIKYFYPASELLDRLSFANIGIYGLTRIVLYPLNVAWIAYNVYNSDQIWINVPPLTVLILLYGVCVQWFVAMIKKHYRSGSVLN